MTYDGDPDRYPAWRPLIVWAAGVALTAEVLVVAFAGWPQDGSEWAHHVGYAFTGALVAALLEMSRQQLGAFRKLVAESQIVAQRLTYQDQAFQMIMDCPQHVHVIRRLLALTMRDKFKTIPEMSPNDYLTVLETAVSHGESWAGIHRKPLSELEWFVRDIGKTYLEKLRESKMPDKLRLFIIDEEDADRMRDDLNTPKTMACYWKLTGKHVKTYWIATDELERSRPWVDRVPDNCALYDDRLLIKYDEQQRLLKFDLVEENDLVGRIVRELRLQIDQDAGPFKEIKYESAAVD